MFRTKTERKVTGLARVTAAAACLLLATACVQQMGGQPYYRPLEQSEFFKSGQSARPVVPGTIPSGYTRSGVRIETSSSSVDPDAQSLPFPVTREVLERGRGRFQINCAVCHGATGEGDGMIVRRGYSRPPSFNTDKLRDAPVGHFYDVITKGFGAMPAYAAQIEPPDRWAIVAYIRALQLSQHATLDDVPSEERQILEAGGGQP